MLMSLSRYSLRINLLNAVVVRETMSVRFVTILKVINVTIPTTDYLEITIKLMDRHAQHSTSHHITAQPPPRTRSFTDLRKN